MDAKKVTVYSCSGCSNVAQLANTIAVRLDRQGVAKMSCIAGVGGDVSSLVKFAEKSEKILVLDGCPLQCAAKCLQRHNIEATHHVVLTDHGLLKDQTTDVSAEVVGEFYSMAVVIVKGLEKDDSST